MSKLGGWHTCYNSERAISNELGGKWELFYEESFDETFYENIHFDEDLDGNPLSLNGVMFVIRERVGTATTATAMQVYVNEVLQTLFSVGGASRPETTSSISTSIIKNGIINTESITRAYNYGSNIAINKGGRITFADVIKDIRIKPQTSEQAFQSSFKLEIYVLRGV